MSYITLEGSSPLDRLVKVPIPRSLPELQHTAAQHFGHGGVMRLFLNNKVLLYHPITMGQIKDGDVICVRWSEARRVTQGAITPRSVHQSDFVAHEIKAPTQAAGNDWDTALGDAVREKPFDGLSRYAQDYVEHPYAAPTPFVPPSSIALRHDDPTGTSCYSEQFKWRDAKMPFRPSMANYESSLGSKGAPLQGSTMYTTDFIKPARAKMDAARLTSSDYESTLSDDQRRHPFKGESTYGSDFKKFSQKVQPILRPVVAQELLTNEPFSGKSEYRRKYVEFSVPETTGDRIFLAREKLDSRGKLVGEPIREHAHHEEGLTLPKLVEAK